MEALSRWDIALLMVAGYWAILALVRLMTSYRDQLVADLRRQLEEEQARRRTSRRKA